MIVVIDYGMGNLHSVRKALEAAGARVKVSSAPADIRKAEKLVFPGVGSFGAAMKELRRRKLIEPIKDAIADGRPFLGLCLGLQLLFEKSEESPAVKGLGVLKGEVKRFHVSSISARKSKKVLKVPHMGWNQIEKFKAHSSELIEILRGVPDGSYLYFVHSYYAVPKDKRDIVTTTDYGIRFASGVRKESIYGFQFHPEKSQALGLKILRNFIRLRNQ